MSSYWSETVFEHLTPVTLTFNPVTPKWIGFLCYPGWMCGQSLRMVGQGVVELLIGHRFCTFDPCDIDLWSSDPKINRVPLIPKMDVWTKFEDGRSRCCRVIDRKRKGYRPTDLKKEKEMLLRKLENVTDILIGNSYNECLFFYFI